MKPKPILFSGPRVKAILARRKTVTRRLIKDIPDGAADIEESDKYPGEFFYWKDGDKSPSFHARYKVGDILYVQETWAVVDVLDDLKPTEIPDDAHVFYYADGNLPYRAGKARVSMFMQPRFSRISLKVVSVRAERLQSITEEDAIKEGIHNVDWVTEHMDMAESFLNGLVSKDNGIVVYRSAVDAFHGLWDALSAKRKKPAPWASNPWVFRYEFEVLEVKK